jgi:hypothetical protein
MTNPMLDLGYGSTLISVPRVTPEQYELAHEGQSCLFGMCPLRSDHCSSAQLLHQLYKVNRIQLRCLVVLLMRLM